MRRIRGLREASAETWALVPMVHRRFPLPEDTRIILKRVPGSAATGSEQEIVALIKRNFFEIIFSISPLASTDSGVLPPNVTIQYACD